MALGKTVKRLREAKGLTQDQLSQRTGGKVSQGAIAALEKRDSISSRHAPDLAEALGVELSDLITGKIDAEPEEIDLEAHPQTIAGLLEQIRGETEALPKPLRDAVAKLTFDYLKTPDAETGRVVSDAIMRILDKKA
jgi:transcriptional regulator with XRE-family HTH domain